MSHVSCGTNTTERVTQISPTSLWGGWAATRPRECNNSTAVLVLAFLHWKRGSALSKAPGHLGSTLTQGRVSTVCGSPYIFAGRRFPPGVPPLRGRVLAVLST